MSSTNKTENLQLNSWVGTDVPCREDFVKDNTIIDQAINVHTTDTTVHINATERDKWNKGYILTNYFGDGSTSRTITLDADFEPRWGIVFCLSRPASVIDIDNEANYNFFGVFSTYGSMTGLAISGKNLTVGIDSKGSFNTEFYNYNNSTSMYIVIAFR